MLKEKSEFWKHGDIKRLAIQAGMAMPTLSQIIHRKVGISSQRARVLESCCRDLGLDIPWKEWMLNHTSSHPAFFGKPLPKAPTQRNRK